MATAQPVDFDLSTHEASEDPNYRRLGLLNGLFIGLGLGLGIWGQEALSIARLPLRLYLPSLIVGILAVTLMALLAGWLTSRINNTIVTVIVWVLVAVAAVLLIGYLGYQGRTIVVWLVDRRFWGRDVYPDVLGASSSGLILGGFLIILVLGILGLLQGYRLENMVGNLGGKQHLDGRTWLALLIPVPFVFLAGTVTKNVMLDPTADAVIATYAAVERARTYEGDLDTLALQEGINYGALEGVRDKLAADYMLGVAEVSPANGSTAITVDFDNGGWVYCRLFGDQLNFCYDASLPYTVGLQSLITGEPLPETCRGCLPRNAEAWSGWLAGQRDRLGNEPQVERMAQWGSHVLVRATDAAGENAIECWYEGVTRVNIAECVEVEAGQ